MHSNPTPDTGETIPFTPLQKNEHSLIIVSGAHIAKMYEYENGDITPKPVVHVEHTEYTDVEGFRGRENNPASSFGTPSNNEKKDTGEWQRFVKEFKAQIEELSKGNSFDAFYLFAPQEVLRQVREILPKEWQGKIKMERGGNYTKAKPSELKEMIMSELDVNQAPASWTERADEALQILHTPHVRNGQV
jgi:hypothetical protein